MQGGGDYGQKCEAAMFRGDEEQRRSPRTALAIGQHELSLISVVYDGQELESLIEQDARDHR